MSQKIRYWSPSSLHIRLSTVRESTQVGKLPRLCTGQETLWEEIYWSAAWLTWEDTAQIKVFSSRVNQWSLRTQACLGLELMGWANWGEFVQRWQLRQKPTSYRSKTTHAMASVPRPTLVSTCTECGRRHEPCYVAPCSGSGDISWVQVPALFIAVRVPQVLYFVQCTTDLATESIAP